MSVRIIAEIGSNYQPNNLQSALDMVQIAADCGADVAKFQLYRVDQLDRPQEWRDRCRLWELPFDWLGPLSSKAKELGLGFLCSVFSVECAELIRRHFSGPFKIASSEIGNQQLMHFVNRGKPLLLEDDFGATRVYLSVPHNRQSAVIPALTWLSNCQVTLMHCVSEYPAENSHMDKLSTLAELGLPVGWSSHAKWPLAISAAVDAVRLGAVAVEAHLRSEATPENAPDSGAWSLWPEEFSEMVKAVRG